MNTKKLQRLLDAAIKALNAAEVEAKRVCPGATLFYEAEGTLFAMEPEPEEHEHKDATKRDRYALVIASSNNSSSCDCGAW